MLGRRNYIPLIVLTGLCSVSGVSYAARFEPGVGLGLEYTDNARLTAEDQLEDLIAVAYVGAKLSENEGSLTYDAIATLNKQFYTKDSFKDQRYFNLAANAGWEMVKNRANWFLRNNFRQRPIVTTDPNTPDNLQNTNIFNFGVNLNQPVSARQNFSLVPMFSHFYYETLITDNKQLSLAATWSYQMSRLTNVGLNLSTRTVNYTEQAIEDSRFTNAGITFNGQRQRSTFSLNLGSTNVRRDNGDETSGFSGYFNWFGELSSRSKFRANASTDLTDTSTASLSDANNPGNGSDVQVTTDVVRNSLFNLDYVRDDASLNTRVWIKFNKLTYSDSPLDREVRAIGVNANYPVTRLLSSGAYLNYNRNKQLESGRLDKRYTIGGNLRYNFSRKIHGQFDLKYRENESTSVIQNYNEFSVYASLVYGFGSVSRPSRAGGY